MKKVRPVWLYVFGLVTCVTLFFQNCAEVQFISPESAGGAKLGEETFRRTVTLKPTAQVQKPVTPIKVLLVVDNSVSMRAAQSKLQNSLRSLLLPLRDVPVLVKIITTSGLKQSSIIENQGWTYKVTSLTPKTAISSVWRNKWNITADEVFADGYDVYYTLNQVDLYPIEANDAAFEAKLSTIRSRILQISASLEGDDREQGLCNTLLALYDKGPNRLFQPGDKAAIVILSDENDASRWHTFDTTEVRRDCRNRYTYGSIGNPTLPQVQVVNYDLRTWSVRFAVSYEQDNDGTPVTMNMSDNGGLPILASEAALVDGKADTAVVACSPDHLAKALSYAKSIYGGTSRTGHRITSCDIRSTWTALYEFGPPAENRCTTTFTSGGKTYASLYDYYLKSRNAVLVTGSCRPVVRSSMSARGFSDFYIDSATDPEILNAGQIPHNQHQASIQRAIVTRALDLFGKDGFFVSSIIHKTNECMVGPAESIGTAYMTLGKGSEAEPVIGSQSICASSYAPAMEELAKQIRTVVESRLAVPELATNEVVLGAVLVRGGVRTPLVVGTDYNVVVNGAGVSVIQITDGLLQIGDLIELEIGPLDGVSPTGS